MTSVTFSSKATTYHSFLIFAYQIRAIPCLPELTVGTILPYHYKCGDVKEIARTLSQREVPQLLTDNGKLRATGLSTTTVEETVWNTMVQSSTS